MIFQKRVPDPSTLDDDDEGGSPREIAAGMVAEWGSEGALNQSQFFALLENNDFWPLMRVFGAPEEQLSGTSAANILKQRLRDSSPTLSRGEGPTVSQRTASESEVSQVEPILPPSNVSTLTKPGTVCATNPHPVL